MASQLVIENGSIVADANSYVTLDEARAYATLRGIALPTDDAEADALAIKAVDYLQTLDWKGEQVEPETQLLAWPRDGVYVGYTLLPADDIPQTLKSAQCQLMIDQFNGVVLQPSQASGKFVTERTVGPLTTKFSESVGITGVYLPAVNGLLAALLNNGGGFALRTVRV